MPKNVMKLLKPSPHRARNDFDLSHRHVFTANMGELLPSTCIETVPGDHITLHASNLLRAIPMVTSPFLRAKQHIDVWFVPYRDLWHNFDAFITQRDQPVSSALNAKPNYCPHVNLYDLWTAASNAYSEITTDIVGMSFEQGSSKLLNLLGYGYSTLGSAETQVEVNPFRLLAYNYIWYNEYRQKYYDDGTYGGTTDADASNAAALFNVDALTCDTLANASIDQGVLAYYKNARLQMRYRTWKKDLFTGLMPSTQFGAVSAVNIDGDLSSLTLNGSGVSYVNGKTAYQTFATNDGTSMSDYDKIIRGTVAAGGSNVGGFAVSNNLETIGTGVHVVADADYDPSGVQGYSRHNVNVSDIASKLGVSGTASLSGFDMLALRKAEAVQIWRENALRAGNRVADNMLAHYGVESDFRDHRPIYLGSVSSPLNIGDVMATASTGTGINDSVGDIAGKGLSSLDEKVFTFDAKDFGVIMAISSILPEAEYNAQGVDRLNQLLEAEDFFVPEFENLGLEAVSSQNFLNVPTNVSKVVGYAPRYYGYKTKLDKCFGSFMTNGLNAPWCSPKYDVTQVMGTPDTAIPLSTLYVNPKIFDVNFSVAVTTTDQFLCDYYFDVDAVRPMSVIGLPFS